MATVIDNSMVDTMVFIYGLAPRVTSGKNAAKQFTERERLMHAASARLLRMMNPIRLSAITWFEYKIRETKEEAKALAALRGKKSGRRAERKLDVIAMGPAESEYAAELYRKYRDSGKVCMSCLNHDGTIVCPKCKGVKSRQKRTNDIAIVATAEVSRAVNVLYSYDSGVLTLGQYIETDVKEPETPNGPMFEAMEKKVTEVPRIKLVKEGD
jgi:predicted nucleic acid-binding protein